MDQLNKPADWDRFEEICHQLWMSMWGDPNAHKYGRRGQEQHGVDIYGHPFYAEGEVYGVQCKGKTDNYGSKLTINELKDEANKADSFEPKLKQFIMATTSPSDVNIQEACRILNQSDEHEFDVDVWSWEDISAEIQFREEVYKLFYGNLPVDLKCPNEIHLGRMSFLSRLMAFITRPYIKSDFSDSLILRVGRLLFELVDNSFRHGKASQVYVKYLEEGVFCIEYDGIEFDVLSLKEKGNGGHHTLKTVSTLLGEGFDIQYSYDN